MRGKYVPTTVRLNDQELLEELWAQQPGDFICLSTKDSSNGRWQDLFFTDETVDLARFIAANAHSNCYFAPMKFSARVRRKEHAVLPCMCWADLDSVVPYKLDLRPTIAIRSSPGRYAGLWLTDRPVTAQLNQRLTYATGADKGGWDLVQVLRLPGSRNYKYEGAPRARVLWANGPRYQVSALEAQLPVVTTRRVTIGDRRASRLSMTAIIDKHQLSASLRRDLLGRGQVGTERRHRMHWRLACLLREAKVPRDEAFVLLFGTAWNKHDSEEPVWTMIDKIWRDD
jgi:RepB DNA-primase from phage plasmid